MIFNLNFQILQLIFKKIFFESFKKILKLLLIIFLSIKKTDYF